MWFAIICLVIISVIKILHSWRRPSKFPPGPRGLPIVGNIFDLKHLVEKTKYYSHAWCHLADIYGPIVGLKLGIANPLIIISGRNAVVEMLNRSEFDGRPDGFAFRHRTGGVRRGVMFTDSNVWREQKRFTLKALKQFGFGKITMEDLILNNAVALTNAIESLTTLGPIKNLRNVTSIAVLNSLWTLIAGSSFDLENPKLLETLSAINDILRTTNITGGILNQLPFLRHILPGLIGFTSLNQKTARMMQFLRSEVANHKQTRIHGEFRDFIDVYLAEINAEQSKPTLSCFDEEQLISIVRDLFVAGLETTTNTIGFIITYLAVRQDVQRKLHEEIRGVLDKETLPRLAHKNRLPYLNATITEVWRLSNIAPTSIIHRAMVDTTLFGYEIKRGYSLLANFTSVHMDEKHWGDPKEFRPERFINDEGKYVEDPWLMMFSLGHRKCLGKTLARNSVFLFIACLLQKFQFVLPPGHPDPNLDGIDGFTIAPPSINILVLKNT